MVIKQLEDLRLSMALKGVVICDSMTALGDNVLRSAKVNELVSVSATDRTAAEAWLRRAEAVGEAVQSAAQPTSKLAERAQNGVQALFSRLLKTQPQDLKLRLYDVHTSTSVCRTLKPDIVCSTSDVLIPSNVAMILELKGQESAYNKPSNIYQVCECHPL